MFEVTLLRVVADLLGFGIGFRLLRIYLASFRAQLVSRVYGEAFHQKMMIVSHAPCTIDYLRFDFRFGERRYTEPSQISFYLKMLVTTGFGYISLLLPFKLTSSIREENDEFIFEGKEGESILYLMEKKPKDQKLTIHELIQVLTCIHESHGRRTFIFPISHPWSIGTPFDKTQEYPVVSTNEPERHNWNVPEVKLLEVGVCDFEGEFEPEMERMYPPPEVFFVSKEQFGSGSRTEVLWQSGKGQRPHSSIQCSFVNKKILERGAEEAFKSGVIVAIASSLALATFLDILWSILGILAMYASS